MSKGFDSSIPSGTDYLETAGLDSVKPKEKQKSLDPFAVFGKKRGKAVSGNFLPLMLLVFLLVSFKVTHLQQAGVDDDGYEDDNL